MNYFDFFQLPISFLLDEEELRRRFYQNSKQYHPDFFTLESEERQAEMLELSTLNNKAYQTLSDFDRRMKYILELKGILAAEGEATLPQAFLAEMMDINEQLMELQMAFDPAVYDQLCRSVGQQQAMLYEQVAPIIENYNDRMASRSELERIRDHYLKKRYLLRIQKNLDKFAQP